MAKRHPALIPVAREHHDILLISVRLQQGERANPKLWSHDVGLQADFLSAIRNDFLRDHFRVEEEIVFPRAGSPESEALVQDLRNEHEAILRQIDHISSSPASLSRETLVALGKSLETHVRKEDRVLFPLLESELSESDLQDLAQKVEEYYST